MREIRHYDVFILADKLVLRVYELTRGFPHEERYGLSSQLRRAAASIPCNLVEGAARETGKEFARFVSIAIGSCEETRYQVHLAQALGYVDSGVQQEIDTEYEKVKQMLSRLLATLTGRRVKEEIGDLAVGGERSAVSDRTGG